MANCLYQYTFERQAANIEVTRRLQARTPEVKHSKKRGPYRKYSAEERTTFQETIIVFALFYWQVFHRDANRISIVDVGTVSARWQFSLYLMLEFHISLYQDVP